MTTMRSLRTSICTAFALAVVSFGIRAQTMTRLSVDTTWHPGNAASCASFSTTMPMSADGRYIAFDSLASNLVGGDTNNCSDVFVQERATGKIVRVSLSSSGAEGNSWSVDPAISATGRYVVFRSMASNLVPGDTNGSEDIFLHDRDPDGNGVFDGGNGVTTRISVDSKGKQTTGVCGAPTISSDGTKVVFVSSASTLIKGDGNGSPDAFLRNVAAGTTTRVSVDSKGKEANFGCVTASLSPDGSTVAFSSDSTDLIFKDDTNGWRDVFVRDLATGNTVRVSVSSSGAEANGASNISPHCLSDDGSVVAFSSDATNLVNNDTNGVGDVFVRDRVAGTTVRASVAWNGAQGDDESTGATIDARGDRVAFSSLASNLGFGTDPTRDWDVFARLLLSPETVHISRTPTSRVWANDASNGATISPDGYFVQFGSNASDLVNIDEYEENGHIRDVFIRDIIYTSTTYVSALPPGGEGNGYSVGTSISANGRYVTFRSVATNLVPFDTNGHQDVFVTDRTTGAIVRVSVSSTGAEGDGDSEGGSLSGDGRFVAFASSATNLITPPTTDKQVYLRDRDPDGNGIFDESNATTTLVSTVYRTPGNGFASRPRISEDGNWIAFESGASDLVAFDTNHSTDIFLKQLFNGINGPVTIVSVSSTGVFGDGNSFNPAISADGSVIAFESYANNLVSNDTEGNDQFVHYRGSGITNWVDPIDHDFPNDAGWLSADGTKLVFASNWTTIVTPDDNGTADDVFLVDFVNGTTTRVDVSTAGVQANGPSALPAISRDGRFVAFTSGAYNLVAGADDVNVYLRDLLLGETTLVSVNLSGNGNNGQSDLPLVADQGDFVVFTSASSDLVPMDLNATDDVFLYDR